MLLLHRYPAAQIPTTNPSFPYLLQGLQTLGYRPILLSLDDGVPTAWPLRRLGVGPAFRRASSAEKLLRSAAYVARAPFAARRAVQRLKPDLIYCDDSIPLYPWLVRMAARTTTAMRLGDLHTAYLLCGRGPLAGAIYRLVHALELIVWRHVDSVIPISPAFARFAARGGVTSEKLKMVTESVDDRHFQHSIDAESAKARLGLSQRRVLMFHGLVTRFKGLDVVLRGFAQTLTRVPDAHFVIVGDGPALPALVQLIAALGIADSVTTLGWRKYAEMPEILAAADLGLPVRAPNPGNDLVVTSALLQYWSMGVSVLAPRLTAASEAIDKYGGGQTFDPRSPPEFSARATQLLDDPVALRRGGAEGLAAVRSTYNARLVGLQLARVLVELADA